MRAEQAANSRQQGKWGSWLKSGVERMEAVVVGIVPGVVEVMKRAGMPSRYAGIAAVGVAIVLVALGDLAVRGDAAGSAAGWVLRGTVAGLAAAGLYSQVSRVVEPPRRSGRM